MITIKMIIITSIWAVFPGRGVSVFYR